MKPEEPANNIHITSLTTPVLPQVRLIKLTTNFILIKETANDIDKTSL